MTMRMRKNPFCGSTLMRILNGQLWDETFMKAADIREIS
jgi:hypothetical protein